MNLSIRAPLYHLPLQPPVEQCTVLPHRSIFQLLRDLGVCLFSFFIPLHDCQTVDFFKSLSFVFASFHNHSDHFYYRSEFFCCHIFHLFSFCVEQCIVLLHHSAKILPLRLNNEIIQLSPNALYYRLPCTIVPIISVSSQLQYTPVRGL